MELHRGRLIDHLQLVVKDLSASKTFYKALFKALNIPIGGEADDHIWADEIYISSQDSKAALGRLTGRQHFAFQASSQAAVDMVFKELLKAGGKDNGAPGLREYHPGYYACFLLDPDGNNVEAVYHGPAERSTPSVKLTFAE